MQPFLEIYIFLLRDLLLLLSLNQACRCAPIQVVVTTPIVQVGFFSLATQLNQFDSMLKKELNTLYVCCNKKRYRIILTGKNHGVLSFCRSSRINSFFGFTS